MNNSGYSQSLQYASEKYYENMRRFFEYNLLAAQGQPSNPSTVADKGIATRQAKYGETKLTAVQVAKMKDSGDNVRDKKSQKSVANPRAN